ncbi:MAG: NAD(P)H-dependent glycerol-3-phosphate dehydrogenase [Bryobacterales bacterium]|nr:NAD(P)-dependent glycerol-3-phosphate dehydrogenase [Bryobacteraceae bacterium]MDW8129078.1 NAD(P)H-dependent glycerol-3-phosphate dehydrogenase [Bryobacterales bacterium]
MERAPELKRLAIVGAGAWGTALAIVLAPRFQRIRLWSYESDLAARIRARRENDLYLPGARIPHNVEATANLAEALEDAAIVVGAMPSHAARDLWSRMSAHLEPSMALVSASKGLERETLLRISQVIEEVTGETFRTRVAVLSGPSFAPEVARGDPAALAIASADEQLTATIQTAFSGPTLRLYRNADPVGVELGAALKNVIAIGAGICYGLGLGGNTLAALVTRGLAEITRLAVALGARASTLAGLAGLGDLVLTCTGALSRNRSLGIELARGRSLEEILAARRTVAEGVNTCRAALALADRCGMELPICRQVHAVLFEGKPPREAVRELMDRSLKEE